MCLLTTNSISELIILQVTTVLLLVQFAMSFTHIMELMMKQKNKYVVNDKGEQPFDLRDSQNLVFA